MRQRVLIGSFAMTVLSVGAVAVGQAMQDQGFEPVDQMVEDTDPLARSLRKVDPGLLTIGERSTVYRRIVPGQAATDHNQPGRLYYVSYGIVAEYDQSQYIHLFDRKGNPAGVAQAIPPNTVFHIGMPKDSPVDVADQPLRPWQVDGRVDGLDPDEPTSTDQLSYDQLVQRQRQVVVGALKRSGS